MLLGAFDRAVEGVERALVACSGGLDSTVLAHLAADRLGARRAVIGHVDHGVRAGSAGDATFVEALAGRLGLAFAVERLALARDDEDHLRRARYAALERLRLAAGCTHVLTAHTADDQAETVLIALLRATRREALHGMPAARDRIRRPFLDVPRVALLEHARRHGLEWTEDPTNREPRYLRNRVRRELLPLLESRYRPGIARRLAALAAELRGEAPRPANEAPPRRVEPETMPEISIEHAPWSPADPIPGDLASAVFDAASFVRPVVRHPRPGDRIRALGLGGRKKLSDVLVDAKVPRAARARILVLADAEGAVHWVPGLVRSDHALVGPGTRDVWLCRSRGHATCDIRPDGSL